MKKTLQVNIGGRPFIIDEDAYLTLRQYLDEVGIRLDGSESSEVMEDIETRIADLFQETLSSRYCHPGQCQRVRRTHPSNHPGLRRGATTPIPDCQKTVLPQPLRPDAGRRLRRHCPLLRPRSIAGPYHHSRPGRFHRSGDPSLYHPVDRRPDGTPANYRRHRFERPIKTRPLWLLM